MPRHHQLCKVIYPIYSKIASQVDDVYWKSFFTELSINAFKKGGVRINSEIKKTGDKNVTSIIISPAIKKSMGVLKMDLEDTNENLILKSYADTIIQYMENSSTFYSGDHNRKLLEELKDNAGDELVMRRKMDRTIMYLSYLSKKLKGNKRAIKRAYRCLISLPIIKNANISYNNEGEIINIDNIEIDSMGCITIK